MIWWVLSISWALLVFLWIGGIAQTMIIREKNKEIADLKRLVGILQGNQPEEIEKRQRHLTTIQGGKAHIIDGENDDG